MGLIVVQYFYDLPALALAKRQLEAEGIKVMSKDELSFQVYGPEGLGGAKLLVDKADYERASQILIEGGFMNANDTPSSNGWWFLELLDSIALIIPGMSKIPQTLRLVIVSLLLIAILVKGVYLLH